jgi:hypothetical protein
MRTLPRWLRSVSIGVTGLAMFGMAVGVAGAQRGGPPPGGPGGPDRGGQPGMGPMGDAFISDLATNLGVSEDQVRSALQKAHEDMMPMMQEHMGEMRDQMRQRFGGGDDGNGPRFGRGDDSNGPRLGRGDDGNRPGVPFGRMPGRPPFGGPSDGMGMGMVPGHAVDTVAAALNMSPEELHQQIQSGQTVAEIAQAHGVNPDTLADQLTNSIIQEHQSQLREMIRRGMDRSFGRADARNQ